MQRRPALLGDATARARRRRMRQSCRVSVSGRESCSRESATPSALQPHESYTHAANDRHPSRATRVLRRTPQPAPRPRRWAVTTTCLARCAGRLPPASRARSALPCSRQSGGPGSCRQTRQCRAPARCRASPRHQQLRVRRQPAPGARERQRGSLSELSRGGTDTHTPTRGQPTPNTPCRHPAAAPLLPLLPPAPGTAAAPWA
jgi:hypothetical protein